MEVGPYIYKEFRNLTVTEYDQNMTINGLEDKTFYKNIKT